MNAAQPFRTIADIEADIAVLQGARFIEEVLMTDCAVADALKFYNAIMDIEAEIDKLQVQKNERLGMKKRGTLA